MVQKFSEFAAVSTAMPMVSSFVLRLGAFWFGSGGPVCITHAGLHASAKLTHFARFLRVLGFVAGVTEVGSVPLRASMAPSPFVGRLRRLFVCVVRRDTADPAALFEQIADAFRILLHNIGHGRVFRVVTCFNCSRKDAFARLLAALFVCRNAVLHAPFHQGAITALRQGSSGHSQQDNHQLDVHFR